MNGRSRLQAMAAASSIEPEDRDHWQTPPEGWDFVREVFCDGLVVDPCPGNTRRLADRNYKDGLRSAWRGQIFVNAPYSQVAAWVDRSVRYAASGRAHVLCLLPVRPDSAWWANLQRHVTALWLPRHRISFVSPRTGRRSGQPRFASVWALLTRSPIIREQYRRAVLARGGVPLAPLR